MLAIVAAVAACGGGDDVAERRSSSAPSSTVPSSAAPSSTSPSSTTAEVPMDPRSQLTARLSTELDDPGGARSVVAAMDDAAVAAA